MEDNLARELEVDVDVVQNAQTLNQPYVEATPSIELIPQPESISKGLTRLEKTLISVIGAVVFCLLLFNVYSDLQLSTASRGVQDVNAQIQQTEIEVENLKQHVQELTRYDRINEIAEKYGLELHEENIRNLSPIE